MERSDIRGEIALQKAFPDFAPLNPGYSLCKISRTSHGQELPDWIRYRWVRADAKRYLKPPPFDRQVFLEELRTEQLKKADAARLAAQQEREDREELRELLRLKSDIAWLRFRRALLLHLMALQRKVNFNPNQPRVPTGNPDGGQWTREGESAGRVSENREAPQDEPTTVGQGGSRPRVPRQRPSTSQERTSIIRRLGRLGRAIGPIVAAAKWLREYVAEIESYRDLLERSRNCGMLSRNCRNPATNAITSSSSRLKMTVFPAIRSGIPITL